MLKKVAIPTAAQIRAALSHLSRQELIELASASKVPFHTLQKIATGETEDPRLGTVVQLYPHLSIGAQRRARAR